MKELSAFPTVLKQAMYDHRLNQRQLAEKIGVSQQSVSNWLHGKSEPGLDTLIRLCYYLEEEPSYMLGFNLLTQEDFEKYENTKGSLKDNKK